MKYLIIACCFTLAGCVAPAQVASDMRFARKAWEEDRRADLEPEIIEAREAFFDQAIQTADTAAGLDE